MVKRTAVYPGSFDPITNGHIDLIERTLGIFDRLIIALAVNPRKTPMFSVPERMALIGASLDPESTKRVTIDSFEGLLVHYAKRMGAKVLVRGLRAISGKTSEKLGAACCIGRLLATEPATSMASSGSSSIKRLGILDCQLP